MVAVSEAMAIGEKLSEDLGVGTELLTDGHSLRDGDHSDSENQVVGELGNTTGTGSSGVEDVLSHALEADFAVFELFRGGTNHEAEGSVLGTHNTSGHGSVEEGHTLRLGIDGKSLGGFG